MLIKNKLLKNLIEVVFFIALLIYFIYINVFQYINPSFKTTFIACLFVLFVYFIIFKILNKIEIKSAKLFKFMLFFISIIIYGIWGVYAKTPLVSDYEVLYNGAKEMVNGTFSNLSFNKTNYFYFYNFQAGFVTYLAMIIKIFGTRLFFLKLCEILIMSITNVLIYDVTSKIYNRRISVIASLTYTLLLFNISGSSVINNQHISMLFCILSILLFMKKKWYYYILSGICIAIANILRPSSIIFIIAFVIFMFWSLLVNRFKNYKKELLAILIFIITIFGVLKIYDLGMKKADVVPNSAINGNATYFKFLLGMQGSGLYNIPTENAEKTQVYFDLEKLNFDYDLYNDMCKERIIELCKNNPKVVFEYIDKKMLGFCGGFDNQIEFAYENIKDTNAVNTFMYYGYVQYEILIVLNIVASFIYFIKINREDNQNNNYEKLLKIIFILFWGSYIFIETQTRYRYDQYMILAILVAPCLDYIFQKFERLIDKGKKMQIKFDN